MNNQKGVSHATPHQTKTNMKKHYSYPSWAGYFSLILKEPLRSDVLRYFS